jgi:hypothetical protein
VLQFLQDQRDSVPQFRQRLAGLPCLGFDFLDRSLELGFSIAVFFACRDKLAVWHGRTAKKIGTQIGTQRLEIARYELERPALPYAEKPDFLDYSGRGGTRKHSKFALANRHVIE